MLRSLFLLLVGCATGVTAAATDIRPIQSWADYRLALTEDGSSDEEADAENPADGPTRIVPRRPGEFLCSSCFLVLPRHQLADEERMLCRDCA